MTEHKDGQTITRGSITHYGEWNEASRAIPALKFFEKYDAAVIKCEFSDPYHKWFAPSAKFYANNGTDYDGGSAIWEWMMSPSLFGDYWKLVPENRITTVILGGHERGDRLIHQQDMVFFPRQGPKKEDGIPVRRTIEFVSGPSEVDGQGTDGLQYYVGKTFWDTNTLAKAKEA